MANVNELGMFYAEGGQKGFFGIEGDLFDTGPGAAEKRMTEKFSQREAVWFGGVTAASGSNLPIDVCLLKTRLRKAGPYFKDNIQSEAEGVLKKTEENPLT